MILEYEIIYECINQVLQNPNITSDECINFLVNQYGFDESRATFWINTFLHAICNNLGVETSVDKAKEWLNNLISNNVTIDQICDKLIMMISVIWEEDEEINVMRNNQLYRKIKKYNVDLSQPPTGTHKIHFSNININTIGNDREAVFTIGKWSYSLPWNKLPDRFKQLYVGWLLLQNVTIPDDLQQYISDTLDISNLYFEIDLDEANLI